MNNVGVWLTNLKYGKKSDFALVIEGPQGSGKSLIFQSMMKFFNLQNDWSEYNKSSAWNNYVKSKVILCDEYVPCDEELKRLITEKYLQVNSKGLNVETIENLANWVVLTYDASKFKKSNRFVIASPFSVLAAALRY